MIMQRHPVDGAKLIIESGRRLDMAATVAHEHHIMINGHGYPTRHYHRACHKASNLVHVCDVFDALRTKRPYRESWETARVLSYIEERIGTEFEPAAATAFVQMMHKFESGMQMSTLAPTNGSAPAAVAGAAPTAAQNGAGAPVPAAPQSTPKQPS
jgi:putative two-component system response regulator